MRFHTDLLRRIAQKRSQQLAEAIVRGQLAPGVPLDETEIARQYNVSRTPVREAIRQLEATGLAEARPRRGAVVAAVTKQRLDEMFFVMLELEALCARDAVGKMTIVEITAFEHLHTRRRSRISARLRRSAMAAGPKPLHPQTAPATSLAWKPGDHSV